MEAREWDKNCHFSGDRLKGLKIFKTAIWWWISIFHPLCLTILLILTLLLSVSSLLCTISLRAHKLWKTLENINDLLKLNCKPCQVEMQKCTALIHISNSKRKSYFLPNVHRMYYSLLLLYLYQLYIFQQTFNFF